MIDSAEKKHTRVVNILLIENDPEDAVLIQKAFALGAITNKIHRVQTERQALSFLKQEGSYKEVPRPDMIILDFDSPRHSGKEILELIKTAPQLLAIPVIVIASSPNSNAIRESYKLHVNCVIEKPFKVREFLEVVKAIDHFWTEVVVLTEEA